MKQALLFHTCILLMISACKQSISDPFSSYQATVPVKLASGTLSVDSVQWGNSYVSSTRELFYTKPGEGGASLYSGVMDAEGLTNIEAIGFSLASNCTDVFVTSDGLQMYFSSNRTVVDTMYSDSFEIWHTKRVAGDWQFPVKIDIPLQGSKFYPTLDHAGNLYFSFFEAGATSADLYFLNLKGESQPQLLPFEINTSAMEGDPYIAPDGSYLIFAAFDRSGSLGKSDLYISVQIDGDWGEAQWMGAAINSDGYDGSPNVTSDGKHLIFTSSRGSTDEEVYFNHYIVDFNIEKWQHPS
jgi:hypothetical protein